MVEHVVGRRQVLRGAGVATGAAAVGVALPSSASASDGHHHGRLAGSWLVVHQDDPGGDPTKVQGVVSFAGGGVLISHDINPAGPPQTGTWEPRKGNRFKGTMWGGQPGDGPGSPGVTVRIRLWGAHHRDSIWGTYAFTVFGPGGVVASGTGKFKGSPIDA